MHICPRCETTLANFEVTQGYKDITDISVVAKFELVGEPNTYVLAWTTTPWTLPGNVALAVGKEMEYVSYSTKNEFGRTETYILERNAFNRMKIEAVVNNVLMRGKDLVGKSYKPLFDYYSKDKTLKNRENGWKIYGADFVTTEEGAGIVHIAPAFGEDDMNLAQKQNLPFIQHVSSDGKFKPEVKDFVGLSVKPKDEHQKTDIEIIKWLAKNNKLFSKQEIIHPYPHCWRCDTPLLNYAANSWFVNVSAIKNRLIKNNKKINWVPAHIRDGRFGKWLEGARDWAVSRSRFWGAPIPVWRCEKCKKIKVIGSIEDIKKNIKKTCNKFFVMRHGEAESNVKNVANADLKNNHYFLTDKGRKQVLAAAEKLKREGIDLIFASDFARTRETAEIIAERLGFGRKNVIFDKRLREVNIGIFEGKNAEQYRRFASIKEKFSKTPVGGENLTELKNRISEFLYEIDGKYSNKNILIVSHEYPVWLLMAGATGADSEKAIQLRENKIDFIKFAEIKTFNFIPLPHNRNYELDFHRPYIDEIKFDCLCGGEMERVPDVFDCWFESGAMPYGQAHYPFENKADFKKNFPAEFIAEGIDQTRGWFYTLLVLSVALFDKPAYKNVIVNGIILSETGDKMSKRLKNYPDPMEIVGKYGADALRLYLLSSPAVAGENLNFSEKGVDEVYKKVILRLWNVYKFYELYSERKIKAKTLKEIKSANVLDKWILIKLSQLTVEVSKALDNYELDRASRPIADFIDDLSTWYIRRSRTRFKIPYASHLHKEDEKAKKDADDAIKTTKFVLVELSKIIAPFIPFMAEAIYQQIANRKAQSVHLESWSVVDKRAIDRKLLKQMAKIRRLASLALEARAKTQIKVRQPLSELRIKNAELRNKNELLEILADEINVKKIIFDAKIKNEIELNTKITPELKAEGDLRELARMIQDLRKEAGYTPKDKIYLYLEAPKEIEYIVKKHLKGFQEKIGAKNIEFCRSKDFDAEEETQIDGRKIWLGIKKV